MGSAPDITNVKACASDDDCWASGTMRNNAGEDIPYTVDCYKMKGESCEISPANPHDACDASLDYVCGEALTVTSEDSEFDIGDAKCFNKTNCGDKVVFSGTNYWFTCVG